MKIQYFRFAYRSGVFFVGLALCGCSIIATRPVQLMSDTSAAIRAAKEVQADTLAPELYRKANEWFFKAKREYKFKNFDLVNEYAEKARTFAEEAEFESVRNGGNRSDAGAGGTDPLSKSPVSPAAPPPEPIPTPEGTPAEEFDQRKEEEDAKKAKIEEEAKKAAAPSPTPQPSLAPTFFPQLKR